MNKLFRISMSFGIVLVAYWAYALVVVPVIAPSVDSKNRHAVSDDLIRGAQGRVKRQTLELAELFPAGSWELADKPKVLESDQAKLLVGEYTPQPDGRVLLKPCTIIFFTKKELRDEPLVERQPIILEAPEGALLQFDRAFDLSRGQFGNLIGGRIDGPVTIRSRGKRNNPSDNLRIVTRNVRLSEQWITTDESVRFQYGKHSGSGRRMRIELEQEKEDARAKKKKVQGPSVSGMKSFQLRKVDSLRLFVPDESGKNEESEASSVAQTSDKTVEPKLVPVEVACTGEFRFDVPERRAAFKDNVVVSRFRTDGPADQLLCDELVIHFTKRKPKTSDKMKKGKPDEGVGSLEPSWLEARGIKRPATIHSTVEKVDAFARELQYHLADGRIVLQDETGKEPVRLNQAESTFVAKYIEYSPAQVTPGKKPKTEGAKQSSIGQLVADGPGTITTRLDEESDQLFTATWQKELRLRPDEKNQVISLTGGATLDYGPIGKLSATSIHFFLLEKPTKKSHGASASGVATKPGEKIATNLQPDRMQADGDVKIESKQISAAVDQFQVWFEEDKSSPTGYNTSIVQPAGREGSPPPATSAYPIPAQPRRPGMTPGMPAPYVEPKEESKQHFRITGRVLQAHVLLREKPTPDGKGKRDTEVTKLTIIDNVVLIETETDAPANGPAVEPIVAKGDRIHVENATSSTKNLSENHRKSSCGQRHVERKSGFRTGSNMSLSMFGRPAEFVGRGLGLAGENINLNRGTNRLWVNGPGTMRLPPMDRDLQGHPIAKPEVAIITWQQEMNFDGETITFLEQVLAETKNQKLYTEQLSATLTKKIDFANAKDAMPTGAGSRGAIPGGKERPELLQLTCHGGAKLNSSMFDELGRLESIEIAEANNLKINRVSGEIYAKGPGWVRSIRRDDGKMLQQSGPPGMTTAKPRPPYGTAYTQPAPAAPPAAINATVPTEEEGLIYINIRFQGFIDGYMDSKAKRGLMAFNEQVHGTFGKVLDWNQTLPEDNPDALGDEGAILRCKRLQLLQMPSPTGGPPNVEMNATGNVNIEGRQFTARGASASYSRSKELIILEGDGRTDAKLFRQERIGTAPDEISAKKIMYWQKLNKYNIGGSQSLQFQMTPLR